MKNFLVIVVLLIGVLSCEDKSNPFRGEHWTVRYAQVKASEIGGPIPGIDEDAISITPTRNLVSFLFKEEVEYTYEVNVRSYLPNIDFEAELVNAPEGMTLELSSEFDSETVGLPIQPGPSHGEKEEERSSFEDEDSGLGDEGHDPNKEGSDSKDSNQETFLESSALSQKVYVVRWRPSSKTIPDVAISEITRSFNFKVNVGKDKEISKEFRYTVAQNLGMLNVTGYNMSPELTEGKSDGEFRLYVKYPNNESKKFPSIYFEHIAAPRKGCENIPQAFEFSEKEYIVDRNHYYFEHVEYSFGINLERVDITQAMLICPINVLISEKGVNSEPYEITMKIFNVIKNPETNWELPFSFRQGVYSEVQFQVYGQEGEGSIKVAFEESCDDVTSDEEIECLCRRGGKDEFHISYCTIRANHRKVIGAREYNISFRAQMVKGTSKSADIKFVRKMIFKPEEDQDLFTDGGNF